MKVTSTSCSGLRRILMRARQASVVIWVSARRGETGTAPGRPRRAGRRLAVRGRVGVGDGCGHDCSSRRFRDGGFAGVAGQGEKHLVEARLFDGGVGDVEVVVPQRDEDVGSLVGVVSVTLNPSRSGKGSVSRRSAPQPVRPPSPCRRRRPAGTEARVPIWLLSSAGVPSATFRPRSMTAIRPASASASSRYWVVSKMVRSLGDQVADRVPHLAAGPGVETGRGLVEEDQCGSGDQAGREIEAAAHAAGELRDGR